MARHSIPMSPLPECEYFQDVVRSPALLHGTLLIASKYHALWRGVPLTTICDYHSALAIRHINSSLGPAEGQLTDGILAAVACLVAFEVILLREV